MVNADRLTLLGVCMRGRSLSGDGTVIGLQMLGGYGWLYCESDQSFARCAENSHTGDILTIDYKDMSSLDITGVYGGKGRGGRSEIGVVKVKFDMLPVRCLSPREFFEFIMISTSVRHQIPCIWCIGVASRCRWCQFCVLGDWFVPMDTGDVVYSYRKNLLHSVNSSVHSLFFLSR